MDAKFLARRGFGVAVSDISKASFERAFKRARRHGFELAGAVVADAESLPFGDQPLIRRPITTAPPSSTPVSRAPRVARRGARHRCKRARQAAATRLAVRVGLSEEEDGPEIASIAGGRPTSPTGSRGPASRVVHASRLRDGVPAPARRRSSMRSRPGRCCRWRAPSVTFFNRVAHGVGNKFTVQAVR